LSRCKKAKQKPKTTGWWQKNTKKSRTPLQNTKIINCANSLSVKWHNSGSNIFFWGWVAHFLQRIRSPHIFASVFVARALRLRLYWFFAHPTGARFPISHFPFPGSWFSVLAAYAHVHFKHFHLFSQSQCTDLSPWLSTFSDTLWEKM